MYLFADIESDSLVISLDDDIISSSVSLIFPLYLKDKTEYVQKAPLNRWMKSTEPLYHKVKSVLTNLNRM